MRSSLACTSSPPTSGASAIRKSERLSMAPQRSTKVIVSKNSHRNWCIVKVQSVVRRWLAQRRYRQMLADHRLATAKDIAVVVVNNDIILCEEKRESEETMMEGVVVQTSPTSTTTSFMVRVDSASSSPTLSSFEEDLENHKTTKTDSNKRISSGSTSPSFSSEFSTLGSSGSTTTPAVSHRRKCINELVRVEQGYVTDMTTLIDVFYTPFKALVDEDSLFLLFCNIIELRNTHIKLLERFEACMRDWNEESTIGDVFLPFMGDFQKLYEVYINNYEKAFAYTRYLKSNPAHAALHKMILTNEGNPRCRNLDFGSFLVLPVQRIPRYIILLKEIEKHTSADHPDLSLCALTQCTLHDLTLYLNESKRKSSNTDKIQEIKSSVQGSDAIIGESKFIMEGALSLMKGGMVASAKKDLYVYLFKDCIICTEQQHSSGSSAAKKLKSKTLPSPQLTTQLSSMSLNASFSPSSSPTSSPGGMVSTKTLFKSILISEIKAVSILKNFKVSFQIVTSKKAYTFNTTSSDIRDKWTSALNDLIQSITPPPSPSPRQHRKSLPQSISENNFLSPRNRRTELLSQSPK
eukprot:gene20520-24631_t